MEKEWVICSGLCYIPKGDGWWTFLTDAVAMVNGSIMVI